MGTVVLVTRGDCLTPEGLSLAFSFGYGAGSKGTSPQVAKINLKGVITPPYSIQNKMFSLSFTLKLTSGMFVVV